MLSEKYRRKQKRLITRAESSTLTIPEKSVSEPAVVASPPPVVKEQVEKVLEVVESLFEPFLLNATSSFNPSKLLPNQLNKLDPKTKSKYMAYSMPPAEIQAKISASEMRSRKYLRQERQRVNHILAGERRKWDLLHLGIQDQARKELGESLAQKAKERLKNKRILSANARVRFLNRYF